MSVFVCNKGVRCDWSMRSPSGIVARRMEGQTGGGGSLLEGQVTLFEPLLSATQPASVAVLGMEIYSSSSSSLPACLTLLPSRCCTSIVFLRCEDDLWRLGGIVQDLVLFSCPHTPVIVISFHAWKAGVVGCQGSSRHMRLRASTFQIQRYPMPIIMVLYGAFKNMSGKKNTSEELRGA